MAKRRNRSNRNFSFFIVLVACCALGLYVYIKLFSVPKIPSVVHYPAFGIVMPGNYSIHGIDVSKYQKTIGWQLVKEMEQEQIRIGFVFVKATEGLRDVDAQFKRNWEQSKKARLSRGAYHYFIPSKSGKSQATHFIETVDLRPGDLPPVLDIEQRNGTSKAVLQKRVAEWLDLVEKKFKVRPIIYTNVNFYDTYLAGRFDEYPLWVAHYQRTDKPRISRGWDFWQHSEKGQANGIETHVDFNVFSGDSADFKKLLIQ